MEIFQYIAVGFAVFLALRFLYQKFFAKKKSDGSCGGGDCGCS